MPARERKGVVRAAYQYSAALDDASMPLFLVRLGGLGVPLLVVSDDVAGVPDLGRAASPAEHRRTPPVQRPAHLLGRHPRVFPPATARCEWPRTPTRSTPGSDAAATRCSPAPRSASTRL